MAMCGADCESCSQKAVCKGCEETCGKPFGGKCLAAEYIRIGGMEAFEAFQKQILSEFNALGIEGLPEVTELYCLNGAFVNLAYPLPNGESVKLLDDKNVYIGTQAESAFDEEGESGRCFGLVAGMDFLLVGTYGAEGTDPELVLYKKR